MRSHWLWDASVRFVPQSYSLTTIAPGSVPPTNRRNATPTWRNFFPWQRLLIFCIGCLQCVIAPFSSLPRENRAGSECERFLWGSDCLGSFRFSARSESIPILWAVGFFQFNPSFIGGRGGYEAAELSSPLSHNVPIHNRVHLLKCTAFILLTEKLNTFSVGFSHLPCLRLNTTS